MELKSLSEKFRKEKVRKHRMGLDKEKDFQDFFLIQC